LTDKRKGKNNFLIGAFIIAASHLIVKAIGALYKIPLDGMILGPVGMGIYSSSYTIYNWLFVISTAGLPVAISKMVAESRALGKMKEAEKIFKISRMLLVSVGLVAFLIMFVFAVPLSKIISANSAYLTMMVMAPSLLFVAVSSSYRGYFQGMNNMVPTAVSEIIESFCKLIFGLSLAYYAMKIYNEHYIGSAGAISGITIGSILAFLYLFMYEKLRKEKITSDYSKADIRPTKEILSNLIKLAIPVTLGVSVFTLTSLIDTAMVMNQLSYQGYQETERLLMYGYLNRAITLFNLPPTILSSIAISIVPIISAAIAVKNNHEAGKNVKSALIITVLLATPCAAGMSALAKPILTLLYNDGNYSFLLNIMGISILFVSVIQISNAILQAYGKPWVPVFNMLIGGIVKVVTNLILVSHREININGAPIGTMLCYITVMSLNIYRIKKITGIKFGIVRFILKPAVLAAATAVSAAFVYSLLGGYTGNTIATGIAICAAALCYLVSVIGLKALSKDEYLLLPKGNKILMLLERYKLI